MGARHFGKLKVENKALASEHATIPSQRNMTSEYSEILQYGLLAIAVLTILLPIYGARLSIPSFTLLGRWLRWVLFAALFAYFLKVFGLSFRPDWVHFMSGFRTLVCFGDRL